MTPSILSKSAQGASFLILLQVASRALTFIVNQVLLRYLSPHILGVATQLELFSISTLYFSRESTRVVLQRQRDEHVPQAEQNEHQSSEEKKVSQRETRRVQEAINLSYVSIAVGVALTVIFRWLYIRSADSALLSTTYIHQSLNLYTMATIIELLHEPLFATAQSKMLYGLRASAEMRATFTRCILTCSTAIYASRASTPIGVLPFAIGQLSYSIVLITSYILRLYPILNHTTISLFPQPPILPTPLLKLSLLLYSQSIFKQLLTSGDAYLIALLTTLPSQGAYALATNYGSLLARILFQPIEESSRSLLARLLPPRNPSPQDTNNPTTQASLTQATTYLTTILHLYTLLALPLTTLAPLLTTPLLTLLAGPHWTQTEAPAVLSAYCFYLPLLAINGLLEAYVSAVATPAELSVQSIWMGGFSALFAGVGVLVLGWAQMRAGGLVLCNAVVMLGRIWWSARFLGRDLGGRGGGVDVWRVLPRGGSVGVAVAGAAVLRGMRVGVEAGLGGRELVGLVGVVGGVGVGMLWFERAFLGEVWEMVGPERSGEGRKKDL